MCKIKYLIFTFLLFCQNCFAENYNVRVDDFIPEQTEGLEKLPSGDLASHFLPRFVDILIKLSYTIAVCAILYASVLYITAQGEDVEKPKKIFIWAVAGFLIITASYALVYGVMKLNFFG